MGSDASFNESVTYLSLELLNLRLKALVSLLNELRVRLGLHSRFLKGELLFHVPRRRL